MVIETGSVIPSSVLFIRSLLASGISDPKSGSRPSGDKFLMTSYPTRESVYPIISVKGREGAMRGISNYSNTSQQTVLFEVRTWARDSKTRDQLSSAVTRTLSSNQSGCSAFGLHDFTVTGSVDVDEEGKDAPKSRVLNVSYWTIV